MSKEETKHLNGDYSLKKIIMFAVAAIVTLIIWNLPLDAFGIDNLTIVQRRVIAMFTFAIIMWVTECIPSWATSMTIITMMVLTASDSSFVFLRGDSADFGTLMSSKSLMATFADPIIMLFLGGFVLAIAATKSGIDVTMTRKMIKPFGKKAEYVLLGFMLITGVFSMFISNTATAAMMLTFLAPVFNALPPEGKGKIALTLSIPVSANIGGMATPIGTPPNAIALKYLNDPAGLNLGIGFGEWMLVMLPFTLLMLFIAWKLLLYFFPFSAKEINLEINGNMKYNWRTTVVEITFALTVMMWLLDKVTGVNSNAVAMIPMGVFALTGVINAKDIQQINWSVIWMVAGGFALGFALNKSGLADNAIESIPFGEWSPVAILFISAAICYFLSNFISHTATSSLMVPILVTVCMGMGDTLSSIGGTSTILVGVAISCSCAMCLPISTPPNAIAHSTGLIEQNDMLKTGAIIGAIGLTFGYGMLFLIGKTGIFA